MGGVGDTKTLQPAFDSSLCVSLGRLAAQMRVTADRILAGTGMELRIALSAGPVFAVVIGETRRYLRLIGEGVNTARRLCEQAGPGQVLTAGRAAEALRGGDAGRCGGRAGAGDRAGGV